MDSRHDPDEEPDERDHYRAGLPDHHDPIANIGGAPPARSALTLRLVLAAFGLVAFVVLAILAVVRTAPRALVALFVLLAAVAVVNLVMVARRKSRGEPG